jgi:GT2 family glycosyltransferase
MSTAIIIVNFHAQQLILNCLASLDRHVRAAYAVYLTDNSLQPDTADIETRYPGVRVLRPENNGGFAAGCNLGISQALADGHDFFLLLNPDTYTDEDFLSVLLAAFEQAPGYGVLGPKILRAGSSDVWQAGSKMVWWKGGPRHVYDNGFGALETVTEVPFVSGCAMLIRREVIESVGLLDERYFLYFEDTDYAQAVQRKGFKVGYVATSVLFHEESSTTGYQSPNFVYYFSRNRIWFMRRWANRKNYVLFSLFNLLVKLPGSVIVFALLRGKPNLTVAFMRGVIDGLFKNR